MLDDPITLLVALVAFAFLGWFAWGTQWNIRKGNAVLRWLQDGLSLIGERTTMRWFGSAALELKIAKAHAPFRSAETFILFEPRDVVFLWAWARARGRRDLLIFRAQLHAAPKFELEAFDARWWTPGRAARDGRRQHWTRLDLPAASFLQAYHAGDIEAGAARALIDQATRAGGVLARLAVQRGAPNLEIHWLLPDVKTRSARDLFSKLQRLGEEVTRGQDTP